jgi:hypothetical protein
MKRKTIITVLLVSGFITAFAFFDGITGTWTGGLPMGGGNNYPVSYSFTNDNGKLKGSNQASGQTVDITDGKIYGDSISFYVEGMGEQMLHKGKYFSNGDSISMNIWIGGRKLHTTLTRSGK